MKFISNSNQLSKFLEKPIKKNIEIKSISIDTRTLKKNSLFIAIKGASFNGNDYVNEALKKGACLVITDNKKFKDSKNTKLIFVNNSLAALKKIAKNIIKDYQGNVIGITGSNGKTTTTRIISNSLKRSSRTLKNFNNEIGMPLSIMNASPKSKNLVIEMGAAKPKDIHYLSSFLKPDIGVITSIGSSHLENLKNIQGVLSVKSELVSNIKKGGCLIVPSDNKKYLKFWKNIRKDIQIITFGLKECADFYPVDIDYDLSKLKFTIYSDKYGTEIKINSSMSGEHNVLNILASFAVSNYLNSSLDKFLSSLKSSPNLSIRQRQLKWINNSLLIDDTYNANPDSVRRSIDLLNVSSKRKILLLGDMLELGRLKRNMHIEIGKYALTKKIDILLGFGDLTKYAVEGFGKNGMFFDNEKSLKKFLNDNINSGDVILIKGSRGMKMERFINV